MKTFPPFNHWQRTGLLFLLILFVNYVPSSGQNEQGQKVTLKVMTYNILHGATVKNDFNLDTIASVINKADPDLVALQEVDFRTGRVHQMDLALEMAKRTDLTPFFGKAMDYDGGAYGEAILSRFPAESMELYHLDYSEGHEPRAALQVEIEPGNAERFYFIGTHLDHTEDPADRIAQAKNLNHILSELDKPAILAGDLNAIPGSRPIDILLEQWTMTADTPSEPTYPSGSPERKLDYIMYHPEDRWEVVHRKVIEEKVASDHRPYVVTLKLMPN
ncbi:MAG: endonuclease/exonuclease/phosphatase family protein [Bacteroidota bacterium]